MAQQSIVSKREKPVCQTVIHDQKLAEHIIAMCRITPSDKAKQSAQKRSESVASLFVL